MSTFHFNFVYAGSAFSKSISLTAPTKVRSIIDAVLALPDAPFEIRVLYKSESYVLSNGLNGPRIDLNEVVEAGASIYMIEAILCLIEAADPRVQVRQSKLVFAVGSTYRDVLSVAVDVPSDLVAFVVVVGQDDLNAQLPDEGEEVLIPVGIDKPVEKPAAQPVVKAARKTHELETSIGGNVTSERFAKLSSEEALQQIQMALIPLLKTHQSGSTLDAITGCQKLLAELGTQESGAHARALVLRSMAQIFFDVSAFDQAAARAEESDSARPDQFETIMICGKALYEAKEFNCAVKQFRHLVDLIVKKKFKNLPPRLVIEANIRYGGALFMNGQRAAGINRVQKTVNGDFTNDLGLMWMCRFYQFEGDHSTAIKWAIQVVVRNQKSPYHRAFFAEILGKTPNPMRELRPSFKDNPQTDSGDLFKFFAEILFEHGYFDICCQLYDDLVVKRSSISALLGQVRGLEASGELMSIIHNSVQFLKVWKDDGLKVLPKNLQPKQFDFSGFWQQFSVKEQKGGYPVPVVQKVFSQPRRVDLVDQAIKDLNPMASRGTLEFVRYSPSEIMCMNIMFICTKSMFCLGLMNEFELMVAHVATMYGKGMYLRGADTDSVIMAICLQLSKLLPPVDTLPPANLYFLGDIHVLSPAWHTIKVSGAEHTCVPVLVDGIELWHLREHSTEHKKKMLEIALSKIPEKAPIVLSLGESDCISSIGVNVNLARFTNTEAAIESLTKNYAGFVQKALSKGHTIFILPPPPTAIAKEKRDIILRFWEVLNTTMNEKFPNEPRLRILSLRSLLDKGLQFKQEYLLNGVFLHPKFIKKIESQFN